MAGKIVLRSGVHIGEPAAEDDTLFLEECFVTLPIVSQLRDIDSSKCILLGRTGSGKTAILNHIEQDADNVIRINPADISFDYIGNSNIISFLLDLECDLHVLFQLLWKHILFTKAIQCYFENRNMFEKALGRLTDSKNPARQYFDKYGDKFWVEHDEVLREISGGFEERVAGDLRSTLGADFAKVEGGLSSHLLVTNAQRKEIVARIKHAVSDLQMRDLGRAIDALDDLMENKQKNYYIIIDDLDLDWAENRVKYDLIRAHIESVKSFRKLRNVKVLIGLRSDLYERALIYAESDSLQPEKYEGLTVEIKWSPSLLRTVVDKRIEYLFRYQYTKQGVHFKDVFPDRIRKISAFDYIVERTLYRPRDVIAFVNAILDRAAGSVSISARNITDSEAEYSRKRYQALCREWKTLHPNLDLYLAFLKQRTGKNEVKELAFREVVFDLCLQVSDAQKEGMHRDSVVRQCDIYAKRENESKLLSVASSLLSILYKTGAISLKLSKGDVYKVSYRDEPFIIPEQISLDAAFVVSPMLWRMLGITPNIG